MALGVQRLPFFVTLAWFRGSNCRFQDEEATRQEHRRIHRWFSAGGSGDSGKHPEHEPKVGTRRSRSIQVWDADIHVAVEPGLLRGVEGAHCGLSAVDWE